MVDGREGGVSRERAGWKAEKERGRNMCSLWRCVGWGNARAVG